jgi:AraC family transcriptional regulator, melibiose operon regulatory protein
MNSAECSIIILQETVPGYQYPMEFYNNHPSEEKCMFYTIDLMSDCSERVHYNIPGHPVYANRACLSVYRNMALTCHWHDDLEFGYVLSGHMTYSVNGETIEVGSGKGIFINARQLHNNFSGDGTDSEYICLLIHPSLLCADKYLEETYIKPLTSNGAFTYTILHRDIQWQRELLSAVQGIQEAYAGKDKALGLKVQSLSYQIASLLSSHMPESGPHTAQADKRISSLRKMVGFVQQHYDEKITLAGIASSGGVSASSCCDIFRRHLHQTPIGFLTSYRLEKSMELMKNPGLSITEIALSTGFSSSSYFTECFRRKLGLTPTEYQRHEKNQQQKRNER